MKMPRVFFQISNGYTDTQDKDVRQEPARPGAFSAHSTGTHRKHTGRWKQYSGRNFLGIFSDDFRPFPTGKHRELAGIHRKKVPAGILLPLPVLSCGIRWPESSSWVLNLQSTLSRIKNKWRSYICIFKFIMSNIEHCPIIDEDTVGNDFIY